MQDAVTCKLQDAFALVRGDGLPQNDATDRIWVYPSRSACSRFCPDERTSYVAFGAEATQAHAKFIYVPSLYMPDERIDALIDYTLSNDVRLIVSCASTLENVGKFDNRFGKSEVMALHAFGLLSYSTVVSGVYLDKDDLSLMAQEHVSLTVLPTHDAGYGNGVAPVSAALERGVTVHIGTGDGVYDRTRNVLYEASVLRLLVSAQMNKTDALSVKDLTKMCLVDDADNAAYKQAEKLLSQI